MSFSTMLKSLATGVLILTGIFLIALSIKHNLSLWLLFIGNILTLTGLDLRYGTVRVEAKIALEKRIEDLKNE